MSKAKNWLFETASEPTFIQSSMSYLWIGRVRDYKYNCFVEFKNQQKISALNTYFKKNNVKNAEPTIVYNFDEKNIIKEFGVRTKQGQRNDLKKDTKNNVKEEVIKQPIEGSQEETTLIVKYALENLLIMEGFKNILFQPYK